MTMERYAPRHARQAPAADDGCAITAGSHVGLVLEYLRVHGGPVFLYEVDPAVALTLADDRLADTLA